MAVDAGHRTYRLEPLDTSGVFLGLGMVQCVSLGAGIALGVVTVTAGMPVVVAAVPVLLAGAVAFVRIGDHTVWEWVPLGARYALARAGRGGTWVAPLPLLPGREGHGPALPPCLEGLDIVDLEWRGRLRMAAIRDRHRRTLTAVMPVDGHQFAVDSRDDQERKLAGWGEVLAQFAVEHGPVSHVWWSALARPSVAGERPEAPVAGGHDDISPRGSYRQVLDLVGRAATSHDTVVGITVTRDRLGRRGAGGGDDHLGDALATATDALIRGLRSAALTPGDPLGATGLARLLRTRIDPPSAGLRRGGDRRRLTDRLGLASPATAGPLALHTAWDHIRVDGAWHRTWWVSSWPRLAVPPSWLEPFITADVTRTMTVDFVPVPVRASRKAIQRDLVKLESDAMAKQEKGRRVDAGHDRATQALLEREQELVAGFAEMAYVGLVSVAASSEDELEAQSEVVEQLAHEAGIDLRLLDGRQDVAWAAALPLGLAPKTLVTA